MKDVEGSQIIAPEYLMDRAFQDIDDPDLLAIGPVDKDLACGQNYAPREIMDDAISSLLSEELRPSESS